MKTEQIARAIAASHIRDSTDEQLIEIRAGDLVRMLVESYERATDNNPTWGICNEPNMRLQKIPLASEMLEHEQPPYHKSK